MLDIQKKIPTAPSRTKRQNRHYQQLGHFTVDDATFTIIHYVSHYAFKNKHNFAKGTFPESNYYKILYHYFYQPHINSSNPFSV